MGLLYKVTIHNTNKSKIFFLRKSAINFVEKHFFPNGGNKDDYQINCKKAPAFRRGEYVNLFLKMERWLTVKGIY